MPNQKIINFIIHAVVGWCAEKDMARTHTVYPGDAGEQIEQEAERLDISVSRFYKRAAIAMIESDDD